MEKKKPEPPTKQTLNKKIPQQKHRLRTVSNKLVVGFS